MHGLDLAVLAGYVLAVVLLGARFFRGERTASRFTSADGRLGGKIVGLSLFAAISIYVGVGGFFDLRKLFRDIQSDREEDDGVA